MIFTKATNLATNTVDVPETKTDLMWFNTSVYVNAHNLLQLDLHEHRLWLHSCRYIHFLKIFE